MQQNISTWINENRVSKHFVISLNSPCLSLFTVLFAYVAVFGCFVVRDLCRSGCRQNFANFFLTPSLPLCCFFSSHNCLSKTSDIYLKSVRA